MISAFSADFQLAHYGNHKLEELNRMIQNNDTRLMQDIDLLDELDYGLRYGKIKIIGVEENEKTNT